MSYYYAVADSDLGDEPLVISGRAVTPSEANPTVNLPASGIGSFFSGKTTIAGIGIPNMAIVVALGAVGYLVYKKKFAKKAR